MSQQVYTGRWTDRSYNSIVGDRITIATTHGRYLIAFVATFDLWVGFAAWSLLAFIIHQCRSTREAQDALFHQSQVALRNSATATSFLTATVTIAWAWRKKSCHALARICLLAVGPILLSLAFAAAGIFSARIASTGDVLLVGGDCGLNQSNNGTGAEQIVAELVSDFENGVQMSLSNAYASECYVNPLDLDLEQVTADSSHLSCNGYSKAALNYTASINNACPFQEACSVPETEILRLDTGYLDSHHDLGLNQPQKNRVSFRKISTCSPLKTEGYSSNAFSEVEGFGNVSVYSYGANQYQPTRFGVTGSLPYENATFIYGADSYTGSQSAYYLMIASNLQNGSTGWQYQPSPSIMHNPSKPMSLIFLANRGFYEDMVNDTWFNATQPKIEVADLGTQQVEQTLYLSGNPGSVLACTEQMQICNPNTTPPLCTDLDSWYLWGGFHSYYFGTAMPALSNISLNPIQTTTALILLDAAAQSTQWAVVDQLSSASLIASHYISLGELYWSRSLPRNQWAIEAANWFSIGLAQLQRNFISNYRRPSDPALLDTWMPFPEGAKEAQMWCGNQKVRSAEFTTFSVLGLAINFGLGGLLLLAGHVVPIAAQRWRGSGKRGGAGSAGRERWILDSAFQLQRMVLEGEGKGKGEWVGEESTVPITREVVSFSAPQFAESAEPLLTEMEEGKQKKHDVRSVSEQVLLEDASDLEVV